LECMYPPPNICNPATTLLSRGWTARGTRNAMMNMRVTVSFQTYGRPTRHQSGSRNPPPLFTFPFPFLLSFPPPLHSSGDGAHSGGELLGGTTASSPGRARGGSSWARVTVGWSGAAGRGLRWRSGVAGRGYGNAARWVGGGSDPQRSDAAGRCGDGFLGADLYKRQRRQRGPWGRAPPHGSSHAEGAPPPPRAVPLAVGKAAQQLCLMHFDELERTCLSSTTALPFR